MSYLQLVNNHIQEGCEITQIPSQFYNRLLLPINEIIVNFPVILSSGKVEFFKGYRIQHNNLIGPFKGGLRFHPMVTLDECKALAASMSIKCALQNISFGGGKGGLKIDPNHYSQQDILNISKQFSTALSPYIGPYRDIPAPDVNTNSLIMNTMTKQYMDLHPNNATSKAAFTGKSIDFFGSQLREEATGLGLSFCIIRWAERNNISLEGKTYILQGFGNAGKNIAKLLSKQGMTLIAVGDHSEYIKCEHGFNVYELEKYVLKNRCIKGYQPDKVIDVQDFWKTRCDVLIPAALELQITKEIAKNIKCSLIVEAANGPVTFEACKICYTRDIEIIPDVLANSGGVVVSYYEWLQNIQSRYWERTKIYNLLLKQMTQTFDNVHNLARTNKISYKQAAYAIACQRLYNTHNSTQQSKL